MGLILGWKQAQEKLKQGPLGDVITQFWELRLKADPYFTFQQLLDFVSEHGEWRPNSPGRILELLKKEGRINYVVEKASYKNRRASVYRAVRL